MQSPVINPTLENLPTRMGHHIRKLRKARGWTQLRFAKEAGLDRAFISELERGSKTMSYVYAAKLARVLGLTLSEFFNGL